ncbi:hypothetical protein [uncultured Paracoccus sp.]|uniref:hypothetical protein n=1 Tax=uncultured Paracoccus sp. TaxID=189685 RepID=UPI0025D41F83|nr:hypothetical protein [uncultured Paracoccus sp.]
MTLASPSKSLNAAGVLAVLLLAGCMQAVPVAAPPPVAAVPAVPAVPPVAAPVLRPAPPVPVPAVPAVPTGPVDSRTGLHRASVISVTGDADSRFTVLFRPAQTDAGKISAAPAHVCRQAGRDLGSSRTNTPGAGSAMPGVQMMIVTCAAA